MSTIPVPFVSKPMVERIIEATCIHFGITEDTLKLKNAGNEIVYYRKTCWCVIREETPMSYGRIAARFGFTDHKHVILFVDEMQAHRNIYPRIFHDLQRIKDISLNIDAILKSNSNGVDIN